MPGRHAPLIPPAGILYQEGRKGLKVNAGIELRSIGIAAAGIGILPLIPPLSLLTAFVNVFCEQEKSREQKRQCGDTTIGYQSVSVKNIFNLCYIPVWILLKQPFSFLCSLFRRRLLPPRRALLLPGCWKVLPAPLFSLRPAGFLGPRGCLS